jgi:hypothetical protein
MPNKKPWGLLLVLSAACFLYLPRTAHAQGAGERAISPALAEAVRSASRLAGVRFTSLLSQLAHESALQTDAKNPGSSAAGPAQFLETTWLELIRDHGAAFGLAAEARQIVTRDGRPEVDDPRLKTRLLHLREDPHLAAAMAARYLVRVGRELTKLLGHHPSDVDTRMAYLLGAGGAAQLLIAARKQPRAPAADILPDAARANPALFKDGDGKALSAAACVTQIRQLLTAQDEWSAQFEPPPPREHIGDLVAAPAQAG